MDAVCPVTGVTAVGATKNEYEFTQNWFQYAEHIWPQLIKHLPASQGGRRYLELGSFEGRSAVWIIENMMSISDQLVCVDTWEGGEEHAGMDMAEVEARFDANIHRARNKIGMRDVIKIKSSSSKALAQQLSGVAVPFDFIYIDASHQAPDVLSDAVMAWKLLKQGGIMVFDDYLWGDPRVPLRRPKMAIDAFMNIYAAEINVMNIGLQMAIKKVVMP
jgi:predicted O-methyltransferase YrrM